MKSKRIEDESKHHKNRNKQNREQRNTLDSIKQMPDISLTVPILQKIESIKMRRLKQH